MDTRAELLRLAIEAFDRGDLSTVASILERSKYPIDHENAANCRRLAVGGASQMLQMQRSLLQQHLNMAETLGN